MRMDLFVILCGLLFFGVVLLRSLWVAYGRPADAAKADADLIKDINAWRCGK